MSNQKNAPDDDKKKRGREHAKESERDTEEDDETYTIDFNTSSAVSKIHIKFLILYIPIFWASGFLCLSFWIHCLNFCQNLINLMFFLPVVLLGEYYIFILGCVILTKLVLVIVNLIHQPKQGIFLAKEGKKDFEFWRLRKELKKLGVWLLNNSPLPWADAWAFRWFGIKMDFSSHLTEAWVDVEFIKLGRKVTIGQGAVVMSSMVIGKYLIIKEILIDDYAVVGGVSTIAPGTIFGRETVLGALSSTNFKQILEDGWIYFGIPGIQLKKNRFIHERKDVIVKRDVDSRTKSFTTQEVNIDEEKKHLVKAGGEE
ncbi:MAG: hypothetical protein R6U96_17365 [Promethearchaeia archaeon]